MKIAITADPSIPVPPIHYGGIERIIYMLIEELVARGHELILFAHKDSKVPCKLIAYTGEGQSYLNMINNTRLITYSLIKEKPDVIHSFGRLAYLTFLLPFPIKKIMSYQREPTLSQIITALRFSKKGSLIFTGCSEYIAAKIRHLAPSFAIHNFVDIKKYDFNEHVDDNAPLVFLGRIEHIKGAHIAIEIAIKSGKNLIVAGNIPQEEIHLKYFENEIKPHINNATIKYIGPVNDVQKNQILGSACAFLMPVLWNEPFGIVMAEALACGTPVLGFPSGAIPEVIRNGENGFLCDTKEELLEAIQKLSNQMRKNARKDAQNRFDVQYITDQYIELYNYKIYK